MDTEDCTEKSTPVRAAFVMERNMGHGTFYSNLRPHLDEVPRLNICWSDVRFAASDRFWERLPLIPERVRGILRGREEVRSGLRRQEWDLAFFNTHVPARLSGRLIRDRAYVISTDITPILHDGMSEHYGRPLDKNRIIWRYKHRLHQKLFQNAARVAPWSSWVRDSLIQDYAVDATKIEVIAPGVDLKRWHPAPTTSDEEVRILFVGADFYRKGGETLLRAFRSLPPKGARLDVVTKSHLDVGEGVGVHPNIQPNSPELIALFQSSDIFVLPTQAEAFGIVAVEAAATGLPVVATRIGGLPDIVVHGETGFLFDRANEEQMRQHLLRLIENPELRRKMGAAARKRAEARFDARKNAFRIAHIVLNAAIDRRQRH